MSKKLITWIFLPCLIMMSACVREYQEKPVSNPAIFETEGMIPGFMRIKVTEELAARLEQQAGPDGIIRNIGVKSSDDILQGFGFESMKRTFPYAGKFEARTRKEGLHLWYNVIFNPEVSLTKAGNDLSDIEGISIIEGRPAIKRPEYTSVPVDLNGTATRAGAQDIFDDPYLSEQWHYYNDGSLYGSTAGCDVNVIPAWEKGYVGNPDVIVAVTDGGIDYRHVDLKDNLWINEAELNGVEGVDDDGNGYVDDIYGYDFVYSRGIYPDDHGTHVAGTIAAVNNNGIGVSGIAGGNKALGIPGVRVMSCQIFYGEEGAYDVAPAFKYAADNGAVISQNSWGYENTSTIFESDKDAIDYFIKYAGIDENGNQTGPMKGGLVIFAAGNDNKSYGSPGSYENVIAVSALAADFERAYYSNYGSWCDIAAPGGDAYKSQYVISTTTNNSYEGFQGTSMACPHVSGIAALILSIYGGEGFTPDQLREMLESTANPVIYEGHNSRYDGQLGKGLVDVGAILNNYVIENPLPQPVTDLKAESTGTSSIRLSWTVTANENGKTPVSYNIYFSTGKFDSSIDRNSLPEGISAIRIDNDRKAGEKFEYDLTGLEDGTTYYIAADASDGSQLSELSPVVSCQTVPNAAPEATDEIPDIVLPGIGYGKSFDLDDYFHDENGDILAYRCSYPKQYIEAAIDGSILTVKATAKANSEISVTATDPSGESASLKFRVSIMETGLEYFCYPNPVIDVMYIKSSAPSGTVNVSVEALSGKKVYEITGYDPSSDSPEPINLSTVKTGNYTVIITDSQGNITRQNIMKL